MRILIVDDDPEICRLVAIYLRKHGHSVHTAPDPLQAFRLLTHDSFDLLIADLMMPFVDGLTFVEQLKQNPQTAALPVVVITAYPSDEVTEKLRERGVLFTLGKPLDFARLMTVIHTLE